MIDSVLEETTDDVTKLGEVRVSLPKSNLSLSRYISMGVDLDVDLALLIRLRAIATTWESQSGS